MFFDFHYPCAKQKKQTKKQKTKQKQSVQAAKISSSNYDGCSGTSNSSGSDGYQQIELSQAMVDRTSNDGSYYMDCTVMTTTDNVYDSSDLISSYDDDSSSSIFNDSWNFTDTDFDSLWSSTSIPTTTSPTTTSASNSSSSSNNWQSDFIMLDLTADSDDTTRRRRMTSSSGGGGTSGKRRRRRALEARREERFRQQRRHWRQLLQGGGGGGGGSGGGGDDDDDSTSTFNSTVNDTWFDSNFSFSTTGVNSDDSDSWLDSCDAIIITFNTTNASLWLSSVSSSDDETTTTSGNANESAINYPTCSFFNETTLGFETSGCYVINIETYLVQCACRHTTYFGVKSDDFKPSINYVSKDDWAELSFENLMEYPIGVIFAFTWVSFCCLMLFLCNFTKCARKVEDMPLIVQEKAIFYENDEANQKEKQKYRSVAELRLVSDPKFKNKSYCSKVFILWKIFVCNDHLWFGICCRHNGTFFTHNQRISVLMVRLLTTMAGIVFTVCVCDIFILFFFLFS